MEIPAEEKVYRCEYCHHPVIYEDIQKGGCVCGSRRVRITTSVTSEEEAALKARGFEFRAEYWCDEKTAEQERILGN